MTYASPILLDTGRSTFGWSRIADAFRCPQLYAYGDGPGCLNLVAGFESRMALDIGTLGHMGLAHFYRRMQARQQGLDPSAYYAPLDAVAEYARRHGGDLPRYVETVSTVLQAYLRDFPEEPGRILRVEEEHVVTVGWRWEERLQRWIWGLWYLGLAEEVDLQALASPLCPELVQSAFVGWVKPYRLNVPGHPRHQAPVLRTRRLDLEVGLGGRAVESWDHKFKSFVGNRTAEEYEMDGQFALARTITEQRYRWWQGRERDDVRWSRVRLNAIRRAGAFTVLRPVMPQQEADVSFPYDLIEREENIMRWQVQGRDPWHWPKARHEQVCRSAYGSCAALKLCKKGKAAVPELSPEDGAGS